MTPVVGVLIRGCLVREKTAAELKYYPQQALKRAYFTKGRDKLTFFCEPFVEELEILNPLRCNGLPHSDITPCGVEGQRNHLLVPLYAVDGQLPCSGRRTDDRRVIDNVKHGNSAEQA